MLTASPTKLTEGSLKRFKREENKKRNERKKRK